MTETLPQPFEVARHWAWADYAPYYQALQETELTEANIDAWVANWSALYSTFSETGTWLRNYSNLDSNDEEADAQLKTFMHNLYPPVQKAQFDLQTKLLECGLTPHGLEITLRQMKASNDIFSEDNLPLLVQVDEVARGYGRIYGSQAVEWDGEEKTAIEMKNFNADSDRALREKAWRVISERRLEDRDAINDIWRELMGLRQQIYQNVGYDNYRQYAWKDRQRIDYSPEDVLSFCEAIEKVVVPIVARMREERRQKLGLETLRPWDAVLEPHDLAPDLYDSSAGAVYDGGDELIEKSAAVFKQVDPELATYFQTMSDKGWLHLDNSNGKRPGAYCATLPVSKGAFLFGNATGLAPDIGMVLHEAGHSFHAFYTADDPLVGGLRYPVEFAEVASTAMEFLGLPYLMKDQGGFFDEAGAAHYIHEQLADQLHSWSYQAIVVLFQHWAYTNHDLATDPAECDKKWTELWHRFSPGIDYSGLENWVATGWHRKQHIYSFPFYYIEYALAALGAVQVWANAIDDQASALEAYRTGLKLGNRVSLPELFEAAGAKLAFDNETLQQAVDLLESQMAQWGKRLQ